MVAWILFSRGIRHIIHYLDDFLLFGTPFMGEAHSFLSIALATLAELGVPVAFPKLEGPHTSVTFLGILIDIVRMELRLPLDKPHRVRGLVAGCQCRRSFSRADLESLLGHVTCCNGYLARSDILTPYVLADGQSYFQAFSMSTWMLWRGQIWLGGTASSKIGMAHHL